ncbi:MAG: DUF3137 domain-containing protein [Luteolibacter sp.]
MSVSEEKSVNWRPDVAEVMERIFPAIERVENVRQMALAKGAKARKLAAIIGGIGTVVLLVVLAADSAPGFAVLVLAVLFGGGAVAAYLVTNGGAKGAYKAIFKREIFGRAAAEVAPGMEYLPESMVSQNLFKSSGLFRSRIDRYSGEDYFKGKAGRTDLIFSELHVQRKDTSTDSKGRTRTNWVTVFKGIYLIADFHKDFTCEVKIEPDVAEANFGWVGRKLQSFSGDLIRLENPDFEKAFKVRSSDEVGARYLLTPDMQERLLKLRSHWSTGLRVALKDSCMHIAIPQRKNWFEVNPNVPAGDEGSVRAFVIDLLSILKITETMDLNTRIWTKE